MIQYLVAYGFSAAVFLALDLVWLSTMGGTFYKDRIGGLLLAQPNLIIAGVFYLVYVGGIVFLAVAPALHGGNWVNALLAGAVLGLVAYGTYDITNLSTLKNWSLSVSLVDMAWGTTVSAIAATAGYLGTKWVLPV